MARNDVCPYRSPRTWYPASYKVQCSASRDIIITLFSNKMFKFWRIRIFKCKAKFKLFLNIRTDLRYPVLNISQIYGQFYIRPTTSIVGTNSLQWATHYFGIFCTLMLKTGGAFFTTIKDWFITKKIKRKILFSIIH